MIDRHVGSDKGVADPDLEALRVSVGNQFGLDILTLGPDLAALTREQLRERVGARVRGMYEEKEARIGASYMRLQERFIMLQVLDQQWKDHLYALDHLKEGIGLRGYGQRDPLVEYKKESFEMFEAMNARREEETIRYLYLFEPITQEEYEARERQREEERRRRAREQSLVFGGAEERVAGQRKREATKVGRNDPCPCGSGKKFKKCHGA